MKLFHWCILSLALACGGSAAEDDALVESAAADAAPDAGPQERVIPLCDGSPAQTPELCQQLRYGQRGYCNFWRECQP